MTAISSSPALAISALARTLCMTFDLQTEMKLERPHTDAFYPFRPTYLLQCIDTEAAVRNDLVPHSFRPPDTSAPRSDLCEPLLELCETIMAEL